VAKSFDGFLNNGTTLEPLYWYPSWNDIFSLYQYNVSLAQDNTTGLYLDINATSDQTNLNATNISPVFFRSVNKTNIESGAAQDLVNEVWDAFLDGSWADNTFYVAGNRTGIRTWQFTEQDPFAVVDAVAPEDSLFKL